jgi:GTP-binding protein HflX
MNKLDRLSQTEGDLDALRQRLLGAEERHAGMSAVGVSALTGAGVDRLLRRIDELLPIDPIVHTTLHLPAGDGASLALLHEFGRVLATRYQGEFCEVEAEIPESLQRRFTRLKQIH